MEVAAGYVVTLEYTVRLASGEPVDSTGGCGPIAVLYGTGQLFPPLEARIAGMLPGETRTLRIPADEAYGAWRTELLVDIPRARLAAGPAPAVGEEYRLRAEDGRALRFRVVDVGPESVRADFNPRGAGEELVATVTVLAVRAATLDEERRGRV